MEQEENNLRLEYFHCIFKFGGTCLVDLHFLRNHGLITCEDGRIFRYLTGLEDHPTMKKEENRTAQEKFQKLIDDYGISKNEWLLFMSYLMTGEVFVQKKVPDLVRFCAKVGLFHIDNNEIEKKSLIGYNPMSPEEDVKQKYQWRSFLSRLFMREIGDDWSACKFCDETKEFIYYRRPFQKD